MTYRRLYLLAKQRLERAGVDSPGADAALLSARFLGLDRAGLSLHGEESPAPGAEGEFLRAVEERAARRPLQYILGQWEFLGLSLAVGEGVLCPREDTVVLVEALAGELHGVPAPRGLDLCAGTGAVALGLCSLLPRAEALCLELSEAAFPFLEQNLAAYPQFRVRALRGDVLAGPPAELAPDSLDFIASNPPYVPTGELSSLQPEVQREPPLALDGGPDGLVFYRAIAALWLPLLKPGGLLAVEIAEDQAEEVSALFRAHGITELKTHRDLAGLDRCITGKKEM